MFKKIFNSEFIKNWVSFLAALLDPYFLLLAAPTGFLIWLLTSIDSTSVSNSGLKNLLSLIISIIISILGSKTFKAFQDKAEKSNDTILKQKARSSIRTLSNLNEKIFRLQVKATAYIDNQEDKIAHSNEYLKWVYSTLDDLILDIKNSVRDWNDIVPEIVNTIQLNDEKREIEIEILELKSEKKKLESQNRQTSDEYNKLVELISQKRSQLNDLKSQKSLTISGNPTYSVFASPPLIDTGYLNNFAGLSAVTHPTVPVSFVTPGNNTVEIGGTKV